jgi:hypothetical protein
MLMFFIYYIYENDDKAKVNVQALKSGCSQVVESGAVLWKCPSHPPVNQ